MKFIRYTMEERFTQISLDKESIRDIFKMLVPLICNVISRNSNQYHDFVPSAYFNCCSKRRRSNFALCFHFVIRSY